MRRNLVRSAATAVLMLSPLATWAAPNPVKGAAASKTSDRTVASRGYGNADAITEEELKVYLYFLASDQLEGRNFPSRGYDTAALYVASHLAEWGLKPGGSASGTNGPLQPYLMPIEMVARTVAPEQSKVSLSSPTMSSSTSPAAGPSASSASEASRQTIFEFGKDWNAGTVGAGRGAAPLQPVEVAGSLVFAGNGYVIQKTKTNPYESLDVHGKIVVVAGLPAELAAAQQRPGGIRGRNPLGEACTDFLTPEQAAAKNGALAVVTLANYQQVQTMMDASAGTPGAARSVNGPSFQVSKFLAQPPACPAVPSITAGPVMTTALFQGEKLSGSQIFYSAGNNAKLDSFELNTKKKLSLKIGVHSEPGHGENVVGIIEGSDPVLKNEFVILSAHLDHLGLAASPAGSHNVNNGADDDGSGSTGLLAIAHSYAEGLAKGIRPRRSLLFLWVGGEEKGLWGSQYFAEFPPFDLHRVVADLNIDMIGRTKSPNSVDINPTHAIVNPGEIFVVGPNISSNDLGQTIDTINGNYQKLKMNHFYDTTAPDSTHDNLGPQPNGQRIFYRSDHYNFAKMGIPIAFFTIGLHVDYHRTSDTPEKIDYKQIQTVSKTVAAIGWELSNQEKRPKLNDKLPDQLLKDMKTVETQGWGKVTPVSAPIAGEPF